jgi:Fanconi anemia group M protein
MIVFVQYRAQIARIEKFLLEKEISAKQFVGKKDGITKKIQEQTIADFREGKFDVLVASSIGEEGLDIPAVDCVIFYEPVPSEIRSIQRRGRAARLKEGEVVILITRGTRDEYYYYASKNREKKMKSIPDIVRQYDTLRAPEIDFLCQPITDQAFFREILEILDIRAECDRTDHANINLQGLAIIVAKLPDRASGGTELIGREARRLLTGAEADEGDRKFDWFFVGLDHDCSLLCVDWIFLVTSS